MSTLTPTQKSAVEGLVLAKTSVGDIFSAFDITNELNKPSFQARHVVVKEYVHQLMQQLKNTGTSSVTYTRNLVDLGGDVDAFVYHPTTRSASEHPQAKSGPKISSAPSVPNIGPIGRFNGSTPTPTAPTKASYPSPTISVKTPDTISTDKRHRICVPADSLRALGLNPSSTAYVAIDSVKGTLAITNSAPDGSDKSIKVKTHKVDRRNNVRVRLDPLGISATSFKLVADNSQVVVTPA